jgi:hypothetical protein
LEFVIEEALMPEVFAEPGLGCQLSVVRKVIIPLLGVQLAEVALLV